MTTKNEKSFASQIFELLTYWLAPIICGVLIIAIPHITGVIPLATGELSSIFVYLVIPCMCFIVLAFIAMKFESDILFINTIGIVLSYFIAVMVLSFTGESYIVKDNNDVYYNSETQQIVTYEPNQVVFVSDDIEKISAFYQEGGVYKDVTQNLTHSVVGRFEIENLQFIEDNISKWSWNVLNRPFVDALLRFHKSKTNEKSISELFCEEMKIQGFDVTHCSINVFQQEFETFYN